jgi:hypothetical protein
MTRRLFNEYVMMTAGEKRGELGCANDCIWQADEI